MGEGARDCKCEACRAMPQEVPIEDFDTVAVMQPLMLPHSHLQPGMRMCTCHIHATCHMPHGTTCTMHTRTHMNVRHTPTHMYMCMCMCM